MKYRKNILACAMTLTLFVSQVFAQSTWTSLNGPQIAKNVKDVALKTLGSGAGGTVYGCDNDILLKSTSGGTVWRGTAATFSAPHVVVCKADNANYITTAGASLLQFSSNGGASWIPKDVGLPLNPLRLVGSQISGYTNLMYLCRKLADGTNQVYTSANGGLTWNRSISFDPVQYPTDLWDAAPYPVNATRASWVWVCGSVPSGVQKSNPRNPSAIAFDRGVWFSADAGASWTAYTMGDFNLRSIAVIPKTNTVLFVATDEGQIYKSTNSGIAWSLTNFSSASSVRMIRVNTSTTPNYVFLATNNGVYRSIDEGISWDPISNGMGTDLNVQSIAVYSAGNTVLVGTANSLYKSTDNGVTWTDVGVMNVSSLSVNGNQVWAGNRSNSFVGRYDPAPGAWTNTYINSPSSEISLEHVYINPFDPSKVFASGALPFQPPSSGWLAKLYRTSDNGANWVERRSSGTLGSESRFYGVVAHPTTPNIMYLYGGADE